MAAPTFTSVTPATGLTGGGSLVTIIGTNFDAAVGANPAPDVSVKFGSLFASDVRVVSSTKLTCLPPRGEIPLAADSLVSDITITNEDLVAPNSVTAVGAYTYKRPDLTIETHLATVIRTLVDRMRQQIIKNVVRKTHTDYDLETADLKNRLHPARLPTVKLIGPRLVPHRVINYNDRPQVLLPAGSATPTDYERYDQVVPVSVDFDVRIQAKADVELFNLIQVATNFLQRNHLLDVPRDILLPAAGTVSYPLLSTAEFFADDRPSRANVREAVASWRIEGVLLEDGDLVEAAKTIDQSVVTTEQIP